MQDINVTDVRDLIDALGGGTDVAEAVNAVLPTDMKRLDRESVYKMKEQNHIPHRWRLYMARIAKARGVPLPPLLADYAALQTAA